MKHEFDSNAHRVKMREAPISPEEHSVYFSQEAAKSAVDFLTMLINHEIAMKRTREEFDPNSSLDKVARQMNEATLAGGSVLLTEDGIKAINDATNNYLSDTHIDPKSQLGTVLNWKRSIITSRWEVAADEGARKQKLEGLFNSTQLKPGIIGRFLLRRKGR